MATPKRTAPGAGAPSEPHIYQLHVELKNIAPRIWRRLLVPSWISLAKLHQVLQRAMGWTDSHLHQFDIAGVHYGIPDEDWPAMSPRDDRRLMLANVGVTDFTYEYDFGDGWKHSIRVENILPVDDVRHYPICIAGANACPPEDVGGSGGYHEFVQAIKDPSHPEHDDLLRWCGGFFDPAGFDLNAVNAALRKVRLPSIR